MCFACIKQFWENRIGPKETIQAVLFSISFGIVLPTADAIGDIRLGVHLIQNGHPKWAASVLMPVFGNTFFTLISCRELEKKKSGHCWVMYIPLVILQLYPQWCVIRLLSKLLKGQIKLKDFISQRDSLDGGLGCVEPYCESILQVYVQTALFAYVHNISGLVKKLCYMEKGNPCSEYDLCDKFYDCNMDRYSSGYNRFQHVISYENSAECNNHLEQCLTLFSHCISNCTQTTSEYISNLTEEHFHYELNNTTNPRIWHPELEYLKTQNNATDYDLAYIQMNKSVVGDLNWFIPNYLISILAASYGISKFFRLGHARIAKKILSSDFLFVSLANTTFLVLKGVVLADILRGHDNKDTLTESILWWILFTMVPSSILVITFTIVGPSMRLYQELGKLRFNAVANIIFKQPSLILAPHVTPFFFTLGDVKLVETKPTKMVNEETIKYLSCMGSYSLSGQLTVTNAVMTSLFTAILLSWKGYSISSAWQIFFCITIAILIIVCFGGMYICLPGNDLKSIAECIQHNAENCLECTKKYGFYADAYKKVIPCIEHENK